MAAAEWLYEAGIGEARAALIEDGAIVEARIECADGALRAGAVLPARLVRKLPETRRAIVRCDASGLEILLHQVPRELTEGAGLLVDILREAIPELGNPKPPNARPARAGAAPSPGDDLHARIVASGLPVITLHPHQADLLEAAGWSEVLDSAETGLIPFAGGLLRMALTPAMTLFDIDGQLAGNALATAGAEAAGRAIRRFDVGGSIGIDLPDAGSKGARQEAAAALDAVLPQPYERTAVNGFGFLQIVRRRTRASLPELLQGDRAGAAARALLRRAEREPIAGARRIVAPPEVKRALDRNPDWLGELSRRIGASVALRDRPGLLISGGYVEADR